MTVMSFPFCLDAHKTTTVDTFAPVLEYPIHWDKIF